MTALTRTERDLGRARDAVIRGLTEPTEWVTGETGADQREAHRLVDTLIAAVRAWDAEVVRADRETTLRLAASYLRKKYGVTNRAATDLTRLAELETQGRSALEETP